jgi:hypothetical protein
MELGQQQQRLADLHLYLYRRPLHPELFHIHRSQAVQQPGYNAQIWVIGLGHVVTFQAGQRVVTELTSVSSPTLPQRGLVEQFKFRGERDYTMRWPDGLRFILSSQVETLSEHLFRATHQDLVRHARDSAIFVSFDQWSSGGLEAFSYIEYETMAREFHVSAFHAFPDDLTLVKTQTIFEVGPRTQGKG